MLFNYLTVIMPLAFSTRKIKKITCYHFLYGTPCT